MRRSAGDQLVGHGGANVRLLWRVTGYIFATFVAALVMSVLSWVHQGLSRPEYQGTFSDALVLSVLFLAPGIAVVYGPIAVAIHKLTPPTVSPVWFALLGSLAGAAVFFVLLAVSVGIQFLRWEELYIGGLAGLAWASVWWRVVRAKEYIDA